MRDVCWSACLSFCHMCVCVCMLLQRLTISRSISHHPSHPSQFIRATYLNIYLLCLIFVQFNFDWYISRWTIYCVLIKGTFCWVSFSESALNCQPPCPSNCKMCVWNFLSKWNDANTNILYPFVNWFVFLFFDRFSTYQSVGRCVIVNRVMPACFAASSERLKREKMFNVNLVILHIFQATRMRSLTNGALHIDRYCRCTFIQQSVLRSIRKRTEIFARLKFCNTDFNAVFMGREGHILVIK